MWYKSVSHNAPVVTKSLVRCLYHQLCSSLSLSQHLLLSYVKACYPLPFLCRASPSHLTWILQSLVLPVARDSKAETVSLWWKLLKNLLQLLLGLRSVLQKPTTYVDLQRGVTEQRFARLGQWRVTAHTIRGVCRFLTILIHISGIDAPFL